MSSSNNRLAAPVALHRGSRVRLVQGKRRRGKSGDKCRVFVLRPVARRPLAVLVKAA